MEEPINNEVVADVPVEPVVSEEQNVESVAEPTVEADVSNESFAEDIDAIAVPGEKEPVEIGLFYDTAILIGAGNDFEGMYQLSNDGKIVGYVTKEIFDA